MCVPKAMALTEFFLNMCPTRKVSKVLIGRAALPQSGLSRPINCKQGKGGLVLALRMLVWGDWLQEASKQAATDGRAKLDKLCRVGLAPEILVCQDLGKDPHHRKLHTIQHLHKAETKFSDLFADGVIFLQNMSQHF